jgi:serine/threonine protein kinase/tetratricopeptide (TPR) repeat protein
LNEPKGPESDSPVAAAPTERIGKYELIKCLGKGAMGVVHLAHDPLLDRDVAVKVMLPQLADDPDQKQRFEREARAVARIMHPNVVMVFDFGYHSDGSPYIVMELLKGQDLLQMMRLGPPLAVERSVSITLQILEGVGHAHRAGIVHRDIKPANTFLNHDGTVKIMDFGVARFTTASLTATGVIMGTANYMSPEQVSGARVDGRSDLFSVGCMLYELVRGERPFQADSVMTTLYKIVHDEPRLDGPSEGDQSLLLPILKRALAKNVEQRYQTAADFSQDLRGFLAGLPISNQPVAGPIAAVSSSSSGIRADNAAPREPTLDLGRAAAPKPDSSTVASGEKKASRPRLNPNALFRLMREIHVESKSGHVHFTRGHERCSLRFVKGQAILGTSDVLGEHLGDTMVRCGFLSKPDLDRAIAIVLRERKRLGIVLNELGILDKSLLREAIGLHIREILFNIVDRSEGAFVFEEAGAESLAEEDLVSPLSTGELIFQAAHRIQDPAVVRDVLGDVDRILTPSTKPRLRAQSLTLTPTDGFVLSRIDGTLSARNVFGLIPLPLEVTERSLFRLLCTGTVEYFSTTKTTAPARATPGIPRAATVPLAVANETARGLEKNREELQREAARRATEGRRRELLDVYESLKSRNHFELLGVPTDATDEQIKDAYLRLSRLVRPDLNADPSLADLRDKREAAFRHLSEAYEVLRNPKSRTKYQNTLDATSSVPTPSRSEPQVTAPAPTDYQRSRDCIDEALQLLNDGKYWDAIQLLESAIPRVEDHAKPRANVTLARAYLKNPKWQKRAEDVLQRVVQEDPGYTEAYVVLGDLYRGSQMKNRALAMYRKALELQPGLSEARAGLAALGGPAGQPPNRKLVGNS